jgi:crotonobetainyl-CoA:carnitine CoA-transferase CaiB-like acyl-CoA transferase
VSALDIPAAVLRCATEAAEDLQAVAGIAVDAHEMLTGRAALLDIAPSGRVSAGGATQLFRARNGWCALTLSRDDDVAAVPALVQSDETADPWLTVRRWASTQRVDSIVDRARLLDIPVAALGETAPASPRVLPLDGVSTPRKANGLLVADLTSMWAGPLCGQLLVRAGATVIKVESPSRPDGTRAGNRTFFDWMNGGKLSYEIDFDRDTDLLHALLSAADVIIEGSRPDALVRRGLGPNDLAPRPGRVWVRISGYGTRGNDGMRPAFGDDAAVAGGLVGWAGHEPRFCGDAIADPLTGLTAARAVFDALARGGGELIEIAMAEVAATYAGLPTIADESHVPSLPPKPLAAAHELGADNDTVARLLADSADTQFR